MPVGSGIPTRPNDCDHHWHPSEGGHNTKHSALGVLTIEIPDWNGFTKELKLIQRLTTYAKNYNTVAHLVQISARRHIPRGCRVEYVPALSDETAEERPEYINMFVADPLAEETSAKGVKVMEHISKKQHKTWHSLLQSCDMSKNSKKDWSSIEKLLGDPKAAPCQPKVSTNQVA